MKRNYVLIIALALGFLLCVATLQASADPPEYDLGKVAPPDMESLRGQDLKLRLESGKYKLQTPILYEDLLNHAVENTGGKRQEISYQLGMVGSVPLLVTIDAPVSKSLASGSNFLKAIEPAAKELLVAIDRSDEISVQSCTGDKVCTKTCKENGVEICCEWRCK